MSTLTSDLHAPVICLLLLLPKKIWFSVWWQRVVVCAYVSEWLLACVFVRACPRRASVRMCVRVCASVRVCRPGQSIGP